MLVLRRLSGQSIAIGENAEIIVKVLRNQDGIVSIGVDAPLSVAVNRLEIFEKCLNQLPPNDKQKTALINRLKHFQKRINKLRASNDPEVSESLCPG